MLKEKVTVVICGRNYRLRTDNSKQLYAAASDVDMRITGYCDADHNMNKEDAAVLAALDCFNELSELKTKCAQLASEIERMRKNDEAANSVLDENKKLKEENLLLKNAKSDLDKLSKRFSELEGKNEQLAETLKEANVKAAESSSLKKEVEAAKKNSDDLAKKNDQLSIAAKDSKKELDEMKKQLSEKDKRIAELSGEQKKTVTVGEENKRLMEKLEKAGNFEEAFRREQKRADAAEKDRDKLKTSNEQLIKTVSEYKTQVEQLNKSVTELQDRAGKLHNQAGGSDVEKRLNDELTALNTKYNQLNKDFEELSTAYDELDIAKKSMESENIKLRQGENGDGLQKQIEEQKKRADEFMLKNAELDKEIKMLKKTNSSLNKQLKEMLEDGQLSL